MAVFEIQNACKAFAGRQVLKGPSLRVEKGEVVSIIGPSGGGKSTLLRCATLLERMDSGSVLRRQDGSPKPGRWPQCLCG